MEAFIAFGETPTSLRDAIQDFMATPYRIDLDEDRNPAGFCQVITVKNDESIVRRVFNEIYEQLGDTYTYHIIVAPHIDHIHEMDGSFLKMRHSRLSLGKAVGYPPSANNPVFEELRRVLVR